MADKRVQRAPFKKGCRMKPVLIIEIVSALVALGALATLVVQAVRAKLKSGIALFIMHAIAGRL